MIILLKARPSIKIHRQQEKGGEKGDDMIE